MHFPLTQFPLKIFTYKQPMNISMWVNHSRYYRRACVYTQRKNISKCLPSALYSCVIAVQYIGQEYVARNERLESAHTYRTMCFCVSVCRTNENTQSNGRTQQCAYTECVELCCVNAYLHTRKRVRFVKRKWDGKRWDRCRQCRICLSSLLMCAWDHMLKLNGWRCI